MRTEALRAVRHLGSVAVSRTREGLRHLDLVSIDDRILDGAAILEPGIVRTLDAIHLATALALGDDLDVIATYDGRITEGARLLGLEVIAPR